MNKKFIALGAVVAVAAVAAYVALNPATVVETASTLPKSGKDIVAITVPEVSGNAAIGKNIFNNICAACHGVNGVGVEGSGPPLIHKIYEPGHHADESFQRAVALGVRSHHWRFGDMPPVEGLTRGDVNMIIDYIRAVQRANGIN